MIVSVNNPAVRKNLESFCNLLKNNGKQMKDQNEYACYVNRKTGDFYFKHADNQVGQINLEEWKPVKIQAKWLGDGLFEIVEEGREEKGIFHYGEFTPLAQKVMEQMIRILNGISQSASSHDLNQIFETIARIEIEFTPSSIEEETLLNTAFHNVDRFGAEQLLNEHIVGTYILRKDAYAGLLESYLPIECYTLTFSCPRNKVVDLTIVNKEGRWTIFNGDLTFSGPSFPTLFKLLESLGQHLCTPLYR